MVMARHDIPSVSHYAVNQPLMASCRMTPEGSPDGVHSQRYVYDAMADQLLHALLLLLPAHKRKHAAVVKCRTGKARKHKKGGKNPACDEFFSLITPNASHS